MKITKLITVVIFSAVLTACGSREAARPSAETVTAIEAKDETQTTKAEESSKEAEENKPENLAETRTEQKTEGVYEDNFAVKTSEAAAFADKIKAAAAAEDIEALADLTAFPVYVGITGGGVETKEEFIALGAEKIFTSELLESVKGADTSNLLPSMAGFSISKDGKSNIIFGVVGGRLAISGINYE